MSPTVAAKYAFRQLEKFRCNGVRDVVRFCSEKTGLRVTIADVPGPVVNGYFCLATETDTDDGLPHTLEHLVFMGSNKYPYKGFLDLVANRCLASGTNAWTDTDHTAYTLTTAGSQGFLTLLPIYLDHVFHPLMTDAQFVTEVHHINGKGEDGGVVYCEMQDSESEMSMMVNREFMKIMYRGCGYAVATGGRLLNLRTSTTNEKVRAYHHSFYHPQNCEVIITGQVDPTQVFKALEEVEKNVVEKNMVGKQFQKPWSTPIPQLVVNGESGIPVEEVVLTCPSDDGKSGVVLIGWRGPPAKDYYKVIAIGMLMDYLSDNAASPLERDFIQLDPPFCSSIDGTVMDAGESCLSIEFEGVKTENLKKIRPRLMALLERIAKGEEKFDMQRMEDMLRQAVLKVECLMETDPHGTIANVVIKDFLFAMSPDESSMRFDLVSLYKRLRREPKEFWTSLLGNYLIQAKPHVCVIGEPNKKEVKRLCQEDKKRVQAQRERLGQKGLKECGEKLKSAIKENEKNVPPAELLERCIINSLEGITFFTLHSSTNRSLEEDGNANFSLSDLPYTALLDDCTGTNFLRLRMQLDTSGLSAELKPFLLLWTSLLLESPIVRDGNIVPYETVVKELERDLVSYEVRAGVAGIFFRMVTLQMSVDMERFGMATDWMRRIMYDVKFETHRIRVVAQRLVNSAAEEKRSGHDVALFLLNHLNYETGSQPVLYNLIRQEKYLGNILANLDKQSDQVIAKLEQLRDQLTAPDRLILHLQCETENAKTLKNAKLVNILPPKFQTVQPNRRAQILGGKEPLYLKPLGSFGQGLIASVGACESCHLYQCTPCHIGYLDDDLPILKVLIQFLTQCEGPIWKEIRGRGLAYGAGICFSSDSGLLTFDLYRTSNPVVAYEESKRLVAETIKNGKWTADEFDAAKRSLIYEMVARESTLKDAGKQSLLTYYRGVPHSYSRDLIQRIWNVKPEQLSTVAEKYIMPLFSWESTNTAVTCHPSRIDEIVHGFKGLGRTLRVVSLDDEEFGLV